MGVVTEFLRRLLRLLRHVGNVTFDATYRQRFRVGIAAGFVVVVRGTGRTLLATHVQLTPALLQAPSKFASDHGPCKTRAKDGDPLKPTDQRTNGHSQTHPRLTDHRPWRDFAADGLD